MRYVDTSVLLPYYTPEGQSAEAVALLQGGRDVCISELTIAEFNVALWRKVRLGTVTEAEAQRTFTAFDDHCSRGLYRIEPLTRIHAERVRVQARELVRRAVEPMRTLDALHAALAESLGAVLVTFDARLTAAAVALGVQVAP